MAILTSVISAVYYLSVIKQIFFDGHEYKLNESFENTILQGTVTSSLIDNSSYESNNVEDIKFKIYNVILSSSLTITTSILTLILLLFMFTAQESLRMANILALIIFNP